MVQFLEKSERLSGGSLCARLALPMPSLFSTGLPLSIDARRGDEDTRSHQSPVSKSTLMTAEECMDRSLLPFCWPPTAGEMLLVEI